MKGECWGPVGPWLWKETNNKEEKVKSEFHRRHNIYHWCSTTQVFQQRKNTFSNHSHNQIKDQHTDVFTW
jgi:hypothetical protein